MARRRARTGQRPVKPEPFAHNGITAYLNDFLNWCEVRQYSPKTLGHRKSWIGQFIGWCDERGLNEPQAITKPILERYQRHLFYLRKANGDPLSVRTQVSHLHALQAFFKWLTKQNHLLYNPASELELPKLRRSLPRYLLSRDEINTLLEQPQYAGDIGIRDRAILETFYSTGMRRMELCNLKLHDLDFSHGTVFISEGKGQKDRVIPIGDRALAWVRKYLDELRPELLTPPDEGNVFISDLGTPYQKHQLGDLVKKYLIKAGIDKPGACHLLRHAMATHMLEGGADIRFIQAMLGHAQLTTTEIYTHVSIYKLKAIHSATHPAKLERVKSPNETTADTETALLTLLAEEAETDEL